jgi:hypothetical protein
LGLGEEDAVAGNQLLVESAGGRSRFVFHGLSVPVVVLRGLI